MNTQVRHWLLLPLLLTACRTPSGRTQQESQPAKEWTASASASYYALPGQRDYTVPIVMADRKALHLEGRYNYEADDTGSLFAGWNVGTGDDVRFDLTAMAGVVAGEVQGVAPAWRATLGYREFELFTESEYVISTEDHHDNFFYSWSELSGAPAEWLRVGAVAQRTRLYRTERTLELGLLLGVSRGPWSFTGYAFEPGSDDAFFVLTVAVDF